MSILTPDSPEFSAAFKLRQHMLRAIERFAEDYKRGFDMVWRRGDDLTPQQVIDKTASIAGSTAVELFIKSAATRDFILANRPDLLPEEYRAPLREVTFNSDGTVTVAAE